MDMAAKTLDSGVVRRNQQTVNLAAQGLAHLPATDIGNRMEGKAVEELVVVEEVLSYAVDDQMQEFVLLVEEKRHGEVANLLLRVLVGRDQVDRLEMAKVDVPPQNVDVEKLYAQSGHALYEPPETTNLADVFLLVISAQVTVCRQALLAQDTIVLPTRFLRTFEFLPNIGQLLVDALLLELASSRIAQVGDELHQTAHVCIAAAGAAQEACRTGGRHVCRALQSSCLPLLGSSSRAGYP